MTDKMLLKCNFDTPDNAQRPEIGPEGLLAGVKFVPTSHDKGARLLSDPKYLSYPITAVDLKHGRFEFEYTPSYEFGADINATIFNVMSAGTSILQLQYEKELLTLTDVDDIIIEYDATFASAPLWKRNKILNFVVTWDYDVTSKGLNATISINGKLIVSGGISRTEELSADALARLYIGCANEKGHDLCEGIIDNFVSFSTTPDVIVAPPIVIPPTPPVTPPPSTPPVPPPPPDPWASIVPRNLAIGTNIDYIRYWSAHWMFRDKFMYSGIYASAGDAGLTGWVSRTSQVIGDGRTLDLDDNGWVKSLLPDQQAATIFPSQQGGEFNVFFEGSGTLSFNGATSWAAASSAGPAKYTLRTEPNRQITLNITSTGPTDYMRNIRILPIGVSVNDLSIAPFDTTCLSRLAPFKTLRLKDLSSTDTNTFVTSWADRTKLHDRAQGTNKGICWEDQIDLCNTLGANAWVCVPHLADDTYVQGLARLLIGRLNSSLKVYLEYSNEVWNGIYPQARYARDRGTALFTGVPTGTAASRFQARRSLEIFKQFQDIFGVSAMGRKVIRVIGGLQGNNVNNREILSYRTQVDGTLFHSSVAPDALSIAPYFGVPQDAAWQTVQAARGVEDLMQYLATTAVNEALARAQTSMAVAHAFGVAMNAYEGGQHLVAQNRADTVVIDLFVAANRHPRMYDIYRDYLRRWQLLGGQEFISFSFCGPYGYLGSFPLLERQDQNINEAYKYRAVADYGANSPLVK